MRAWRLVAPGRLPAARFALDELPDVAPDLVALAPDSLLLRVQACGVCHTDLHIVEGELDAHKLPVTPGHQVVATVEAVGLDAGVFKRGDRVGVPWLHATCGTCEFCLRGEENLCERAQFTGWDVDGGYADYMLARAGYVVPIPGHFTEAQAAPLLCAGVIGYRALRLSEVKPGEHLGLFGFGASAHLALQVARHWGCRVSVFTRGSEHRVLAESLGAEWTGSAEEAPPQLLDRAIIFAPAGVLVPAALVRLRKGGTLAINAIHMSPVPEMDYNLLYGERTIRSVANATRRDAIEFMHLAAELQLVVETERFPLEAAGEVLLRLKHSAIRGAAVLFMS